MPLRARQRLGPYEVLAPLGRGGMGEVYNARDTRLDRIVAIKVLREHFVKDPDRRARFDREARAISKLNHPNICALYDVGHDIDVDYIVIEYLDGHTLAERLNKGALLYEMLTGRRAFPGDTNARAMAAVLDTDPQMCRASGRTYRRRSVVSSLPVWWKIRSIAGRTRPTSYAT